MTYIRSPHNISLYVTRLHNLTYEYNKSTRLLPQHIPTTNHNPFSTDYISSSSDTISLPIPLTSIPIPSFHDYTLSTHKTSIKSTTSPNILPTTSPSPSLPNNNISYNTSTLTTTTDTTQSPINNAAPTYNYDSCQDIDFFLWSKIER